MPKRLRHLLLSLLLLTSVSAAPMPWGQLKVGMPVDEVITLLGEPIFRRAARGFETWTYDDGAEVLVCGLLMGWTLPNSVVALERSRDVWSSHPKGEFLSPVRTALNKAGAKLPASPRAKRPVREISPAMPGVGYEEYSARRG